MYGVRVPVQIACRIAGACVSVSASASAASDGYPSKDARYGYVDHFGGEAFEPGLAWQLSGAWVVQS